MFTRVLKGHIALSSARFPRGTAGNQLDVLARQFLWEIGKDYDHGTGHGVGCYLSVHEGPQRIGKTPGPTAPLKPGMVVSNEPGYYEAGAYGIRCENLLVVVETDTPMLAFEPLTLAPFDRRLILVSLLSETETQWIDDYHAQVREQIGDELQGEDKEWLQAMTAPLAA
jgi:Xaa-Pro aminopeptidase